MPEISVIVPVYNVEKYLDRCVESILAQTYTDFELILVDDGSPDNCPQMCDTWAKKDNRIKVIHQANQGQAAARNRGIDIACGKWVCFVDSDDLINCLLLEVLYNNAIDKNVTISCCSGIEDVEPNHNFYLSKSGECSCIDINEDSLIDLYKEKYIPWVVWAKLIDIEIVKAHLFTEGKFYEDNAIVCKWLVAAKRVAYTDLKLYFYTVNSTGTTKSHFSLKKLDVLWALNEIAAFFKEIGYIRLNKIFIEKYLLSAVAFYYKLKSENYKNETKELQKHIRKVYIVNKVRKFMCKNKRISVSEVIYPRTMWVYWRLVAVKKHIISLGGK